MRCTGWGISAEVGIRGPFGNGFDVEAARGKDMLFVGRRHWIAAAAQLDLECAG